MNAVTEFPRSIKQTDAKHATVMITGSRTTTSGTKFYFKLTSSREVLGDR